MNREERRRRSRKIRKKIFIMGAAAGSISTALIMGTCFAVMRGRAECGAVLPEDPAKTCVIIEIESAAPAAGEEDAPETEAEPEESKGFIPLPVNMQEADQKTIFDICEAGGVEFPLVMAIVEQESSFDPSARSKTGDSGLMQINDINAAEMASLGFTDLFSVEDNVRAGVHMIADLQRKYNDTAAVLMAYNAGEKGASRMREAGITSTEYSREIEARAAEFMAYMEGTARQN